jgi:hypothetical protein
MIFLLRLVDEVCGRQDHLVQLVELEALGLVVVRFRREPLQPVPLRLRQLWDKKRLTHKAVVDVALVVVADLLDDLVDVGFLDGHVRTLPHGRVAVKQTPGPGGHLPSAGFITTRNVSRRTRSASLIPSSGYSISRRSARGTASIGALRGARNAGNGSGNFASRQALRMRVSNCRSGSPFPRKSLRHAKRGSRSSWRNTLG